MRIIPVCSLVIVSVFFCSVASAQNKKELIKSGEVIIRGVKLYDEGKYKEAIGLFKSVPRSDTNYRLALYELSLTYYADSGFLESKKTAELGLKLFPEYAAEWYALLANSADDLGEPNKAIEYYDKILAGKGSDYLTYFNKGITLLRLHKNDEAKKCLQQVITINPYHTSSHYFLALIALDEGRIPETMMSLLTNLALDPENRYKSQAIDVLHAIGEMNERITNKAALRKPSAEDDFEMLQEILLSKAAMDKKYRLKASLEDPIVRQIQVLLEKMEYNKNDSGFWMQYYVSFFQDVFKNEERFEAFVNHIFSSLNIKSVQSFIKKKDTQMADFTEFATNYFNLIRESRTVEVEKRATVKLKYNFLNDKLSSKGEWKMAGKDVVLVGPWEFYYTAGNLKSKGTFNASSQKTGEWTYYHENGSVREVSNYLNDEAQGKSTEWFDNGVLSVEAAYKNNRLDGEVKMYFYNGILKSVENYKNGVKDGPAIYYTSAGILNSAAIYTDGKENGEVLLYYDNGKPETSILYINGEANGKYQKFYYDGVLMTEGFFQADKKTGVWKEFYQNGQLKSQSHFKEGELEGEYKDFYENGRLMTRYTLSKGKVEGRYEDFDRDGKLFSESHFERGRLKDLKFYDKTGKIISQQTSRNGSGNLIFYDAEGNKTSDGYFTKEGMRNGKTTFYYKSGKTSVVANYKEGLLNGIRTSYYKSGIISDEVNYTDDNINGYYIAYHESGKLKTEGWMPDGKAQGQHTNYNVHGHVESKYNYLDHELHGYMEYYHGNGKLDFEQFYENGWLKTITQYDSTGKMLSRMNLEKGSSPFILKLMNGKPYLFGNYKHYFLNGEYKITYPDGAISRISYYVNGEIDSVYREYYYGGKLKLEGRYHLGKKMGVWKHYHDNGKLNYEETYKNNIETGKNIMYNEDGSLDKALAYNNYGELNGAYKMYGENNTLAVQLNYENGKIISYTYEGKDGKLVAPVMLKNGTGKVVAYYKNGNKSAEIDFTDEEINGARKIFLTNGKPYIDGTRVAGYDHGNKKVYFPNGQLEREENYYYGRLHGPCKSYYSNGKPASEENFYDGEYHGDCKYYDAAGKLQIRTYYYGVMQSVK